MFCTGGAMSPISSRKIVPVCASRNSPRRALPAPVNAPFSWPNSSASSSDGDSAEQSNATNGRSARGPMRWIVRAKSSLPVPLSPRISTVASECATRSTSAMSCFIGGDSPITSPSPRARSTSDRSRRTSRARLPCLAARWTAARSSPADTVLRR
ncbi:MAG: hypothetical protein D6689_20465 [Deltaproteobacteria bacterium]|nr:MAG: hypothetical protein D6689_20465 [Deltaproteobacteria bacterium]